MRDNRCNNETSSMEEVKQIVSDINVIKTKQEAHEKRLDGHDTDIKDIKKGHGELDLKFSQTLAVIQNVIDNLVAESKTDREDRRREREEDRAKDEKVRQTLNDLNITLIESNNKQDNDKLKEDISKREKNKNLIIGAIITILTGIIIFLVTNGI